MAASTTVIPALAQLLCESTIRIAFLLEMPISINQPNLAVNIILQAAQRLRSNRPQHCHRERTGYDER